MTDGTAAWTGLIRFVREQIVSPLRFSTGGKNVSGVSHVAAEEEEKEEKEEKEIEEEGEKLREADYNEAAGDDDDDDDDDEDEAAACDTPEAGPRARWH